MLDWTGPKEPVGWSCRGLKRDESRSSGFCRQSLLVSRLSLRCILDIHVEAFSRQLAT